MLKLPSVSTAIMSVMVPPASLAMICTLLPLFMVPPWESQS
jgi:hypothetical protein